MSITSSQTTAAVLVAVAVLFSATAAAGDCTLTPEQKAELRTRLCNDPKYGTFAGPDCLERQAAKQSEYSGVQVGAARLCGYQEEADKLERYFLVSLSRMGEKFRCMDLPVDFVEISKKAFERGRSRVSAYERCPPDIRAKLSRRLPELLRLNEEALRALPEVTK